jgi:hypothetical protein
LSKKNKSKAAAASQSPLLKLGKRKKVFFYSVLIIIPILLITLFELTLMMISYGDDLSLFIDASDSKYVKNNPKEFKDDPSLSYNLTLLYLMNNDFDKAKAALNEFARISRKNNAQYAKLQLLYREQMNKKRNPGSQY